MGKRAFLFPPKTNTQLWNSEWTSVKLKIGANQEETLLPRHCTIGTQDASAAMSNPRDFATFCFEKGTANALTQRGHNPRVYPVNVDIIGSTHNGLFLSMVCVNRKYEHMCQRQWWCQSAKRRKWTRSTNYTYLPLNNVCYAEVLANEFPQTP